MNRPHRSIEIFTMSALDLFITAMGSFAILMMVLFPYYRGLRQVRSESREVITSFSMFCEWPTRVRDFEEYVKSGRKSPRDPGATDWSRPGYEQVPDHPVVNVTFRDAWDFCKWLTEKERKEGVIGPQDTYQPVSTVEWSRLAGTGKYPWGNVWPPPKDAGNFGPMDGVTDPHPGVAPVGSYRPNLLGLYDIGGNVREMTTDYDKVPPGHLHIRGSSWKDTGSRLESASLVEIPPPPTLTLAEIQAAQAKGDNRFPEKSDVTGFRIALRVFPALPDSKSTSPSSPQ